MAQIKLLTNTIALLLKSLANKENKSSGGDVSGGNGSRRNGSNSGSLGGRCVFHHTGDMGSCYCWIHGHHPVGAKHDSHNCTNKKEGTKMKQPPQIAWAAPFMAAGKQGQAFPAGPLQL